MNPELRVLLDRANARRMSLLGLVAVIPDDLWGRRESSGEWTARQHLAHAATADQLLRETATRALTIGYEARKAELLAAAEPASAAELVSRMCQERAGLTAFFVALDTATLDGVIRIPAATDAWGRPVEWPLRSLLTAWSEHDTGHDLAIRRAVTTPPDAGALAAAAARRR